MTECLHCKIMKPYWSDSPCSNPDGHAEPKKPSEIIRERAKELSGDWSRFVNDQEAFENITKDHIQALLDYLDGLHDQGKL